MPYHRLPEYVVAHPEHSFQATLDLLDADLVLAFNTRVERWECYQRQLQGRGVFFALIERFIAPDGGLVEPSTEHFQRLRARDSRYRPANEAAEEVLREIRADERKAAEQDEHRLDAVREEVILGYIPLWRKLADPDGSAREYKDWDAEPSFHDMSPRERRESIRQEAK